MHCEAGLFGAPLALEHAPEVKYTTSWQPPDFEWGCMGWGPPWGVCGVGWEGQGATP